MTVHVLDESPKTDAAFGTSPDDRTLEQRLASGFILVDKPAGPTSHQLAAWARDLLGLCLLYTSPSPRDTLLSRMPSSA